MRPRVKELLRNSSPAEGRRTLGTPAGVSSLVRDETREEPYGFFESGLAQGEKIRIKG